MSKSKSTNIKSRTWLALLYPDDPTHVAALDVLTNENFNFVGILHNKDEYIESEEVVEDQVDLKKAHYHIVMRFPNAIYLNSLASKLGIKSNYLRKSSDYNGALVYLVHHGDPTKYQYGAEELFGPLVCDAVSAIATYKVSTDNIYRILIQWIYDQGHYVSFSDLATYALKVGYGKVVRQNVVYWRTILDDYNHARKKEL